MYFYITIFTNTHLLIILCHIYVFSVFIIFSVSRNDEPFVPSLGSVKRNITLTQQAHHFEYLVVTDDNVGLESPEIVRISLSVQDFPSHVQIEPYERASINLLDDEGMYVHMDIYLL